MARRKEAPYYLRSKDGRAYVDFTTPDGRKKAYLSVPYDPDRSGPTERRVAEEAAEAKWRELTDGRTLDAGGRVLTSDTLDELYAVFLRQWEAPANASENERQRLASTLVVRRAYGKHLYEWATEEGPRWRNDKRTPLERVVADEGPSAFLSTRLLKVQRKTMRKEKSNLVSFLAWLKATGSISTVPPIELPSGNGVAHPQMSKSGRGVDIQLSPVDAAKIVAAMPEWSSRAGRTNGGEKYLVRPFFELMFWTGLREATLERLEVPRNWRKGQTALALDDVDDKAKYGRGLPLAPAAVALLEKYAPTKGPIFGHHDFRKHVRAAAKIAMADRPDVAERLGGYHLRHFVGTYLANMAGTNMPGVSYVLGHKDLSTTSVYVHGDEQAAREVLTSAAPALEKAAKVAKKWAAKRAKTGAQRAKTGAQRGA